MRLTEHERQAIRDSVKHVLPNAEVFLYGSRLDENKRGGDIDLLILDTQTGDIRMKGRLLKLLWERIGERKIDILAEQRDHLSSFGRLVMLDAKPI